jgi:glycine hydroxymethyltransferase
MKEKEFEFIANKIADVLDDINNTELQENIKKELETLAQNFVVYNQPTY